jgi:hypothetical protein
MSWPISRLTESTKARAIRCVCSSCPFLSVKRKATSVVSSSIGVDAAVDRPLRGRELLRREHRAVEAVELHLLDLPDLRVGVDELEVGVVEAVLADLLHAGADRVLEHLVVAVLGIVVLGDLHRLPQGCDRLGVVPGEHDAAALDDGEGT